MATMRETAIKIIATPDPNKIYQLDEAHAAKLLAELKPSDIVKLIRFFEETGRVVRSQLKCNHETIDPNSGLVEKCSHCGMQRYKTENEDKMGPFGTKVYEYSEWF